ncbi:MAG: hypothetical protein M1336_04565 [Deltaproteobacteria bacterium]|jgi:uncharacterized protein YwgA|nr:hypothetical protein [Deltaproteobacteria bacterium]
MKPRHVVLVVLDAYGGKIRGKTMLQKVCYFADVLASLGLGFKAHYYGPFSPAIEQAVGELKSLGFIEEKRLGFGVVQNEFFGEMRRYDYELTSDGEKVVEELQRRGGEKLDNVRTTVENIKKCGDPDYRELSVAAKAFFIVRKQGGAVTVPQIKEQARALGWELSEQDVDKAVGLLEGLGLARRQ